MTAGCYTLGVPVESRTAGNRRQRLSATARAAEQPQRVLYLQYNNARHNTTPGPRVMTTEPITRLLDAARGGDLEASEALFSAVYTELQKLACSHRKRWRGNQTMNYHGAHPTRPV
jgi:hypothetical protein